MSTDLTRQGTRAVTAVGTTNMAAVLKKKAELAKEQAERSSSGPVMKLVAGRNLLRFLPPVKGMDLPFLETWVHYIKNELLNQLKTVTCPLKTKKTRCIVCERVQALRRSGSQVDSSQAKALSPKRQIYANVVDMGDQAKGVQILRFGVQIYEELLKYLADEETGGDFTDPVSGYTVVIEREGEGIETSYSVRLAKNSSPIADKAWLTKQHDLTALTKYLDDDAVMAILEGEEVPEGGAPDPEENAPPARRAAPAGRAGGQARGRTIVDDEE